MSSRSHLALFTLRHGRFFLIFVLCGVEGQLSSKMISCKCDNVCLRTFEVFSLLGYWTLLFFYMVHVVDNTTKPLYTTDLEPNSVVNREFSTAWIPWVDNNTVLDVSYALTRVYVNDHPEADIHFPCKEAEEKFAILQRLKFASFLLAFLWIDVSFFVSVAHVRLRLTAGELNMKSSYFWAAAWSTTLSALAASCCEGYGVKRFTYDVFASTLCNGVPSFERAAFDVRPNFDFDFAMFMVAVVVGFLLFSMSCAYLCLTQFSPHETFERLTCFLRRHFFLAQLTAPFLTVLPLVLATAGLLTSAAVATPSASPQTLPEWNGTAVNVNTTATPVPIRLCDISLWQSDHTNDFQRCTSIGHTLNAARAFGILAIICIGMATPGIALFFRLFYNGSQGTNASKKEKNQKQFVPTTVLSVAGNVCLLICAALTLSLCVSEWCDDDHRAFVSTSGGYRFGSSFPLLTVAWALNLAVVAALVKSHRDDAPEKNDESYAMNSLFPLTFGPLPSPNPLVAGDGDQEFDIDEESDPFNASPALDNLVNPQQQRMQRMQRRCSNAITMLDDIRQLPAAVRDSRAWKKQAALRHELMAANKLEMLNATVVDVTERLAAAVQMVETSNDHNEKDMENIRGLLNARDIAATHLIAMLSGGHEPDDEGTNDDYRPVGKAHEALLDAYTATKEAEDRLVVLLQNPESVGSLSDVISECGVKLQTFLDVEEFLIENADAHTGAQSRRYDLLVAQAEVVKEHVLQRGRPTALIIDSDRTPKYWHPNLQGVSAVQAYSLLYNGFVDRLTADLPEQYTIAGVSLVQDLGMWRLYRENCRHVAARSPRTPIPDSCEPTDAAQHVSFADAVLLSYLSQCNERRLFHGTSRKIAEVIAKQGFDPTYSGGNSGSAFGAGTYFTDDIAKALPYAQRSAQRSRTYPDKGALIASRVILGNVACGADGRPIAADARSQAFRRPPQLPAPHQDSQYDSVCGVNTHVPPPHSKEYIVYRHARSYPEFIIWLDF